MVIGGPKESRGNLSPTNLQNFSHCGAASSDNLHKFPAQARSKCYPIFKETGLRVFYILMDMTYIERLLML